MSDDVIPDLGPVIRKLILLIDYSDVIAGLREAFGMNFAMYDTSGGNYCLRAPTETGHWVHITDAYEPLSSWRERIDLVVHYTNPGYGVSVFADDECGELVYGNADETALSTEDVVELVRDALEYIAGRPPNKPSYQCYPNGAHPPTTEVDAT